SLSAVLADGMEPIIALLPAESKIIITEPERVSARAADPVETTNEFLEAAWAGASAGGAAPTDLSAASLRTVAEMEAGARLIGLAWWEIGGFATHEELAGPEENIFSVPARIPKGYAGDVEAILSDLKDMIHDKWRILVLTEGPGPGRRMVEVFSEAGVPASFVDD